MTKIGYRPQAVPAPSLDPKTVSVENPLSYERTPQSRPPTWVWVLLFIGAAIALMVLLYKSGARQLSAGGFFIFPIMIMSMLFMLRNRAGGTDKTKRPAALNQRRADYERNLDTLRAELHADARAQAREIAYHHPDPAQGSLTTLVGSGRMFERSPDRRNFGHVRIGLGLTRINTRINPPDNVPPEESRESVTAIAARDFLLAQNVVHDVPRPLHLWDQPGWSVFWERDDQRERIQGWLRAVVSQLCVFHSPGDPDATEPDSAGGVRLAIITDDPEAWEDAKWLPHTADPEFVDASGPLRLIFDDVDSFMSRFGAELNERPPWALRVEGTAEPPGWLVVVVDYPGASCAPILGESGKLGVSVIEATGDEDSVLANPASAFYLDEVGNLLRAAQTVMEAVR